MYSPSNDSDFQPRHDGRIIPLASWASSPSLDDISGMSSRNASTDYFGSQHNLVGKMVKVGSPGTPDSSMPLSPYSGDSPIISTEDVILPVLLSTKPSSEVVQPFHPHSWTHGRKWGITILIALQTFILSFGSACYTGGIPQMMYYFEVKEEIVLLGLSLYVLGFGLGPFIWSPLSEIYGRRLTFLVSYGLFVVFNAGAAFSKTIIQMAVLRCLAGMAGASPLSNGGAILTDIWTDRERALPAVTFAVTVFLGPVLSPIVSSYMALYTDSWRNIFYLQISTSAFAYLVSMILMPETFYPVIAKQKGVACASKQAAGGLMGAIKRPITMLASEVICLFLALWIAILYGTLYLLFAAFPVVFQLNRGWDEAQASLPFLGIGLGMLLIFPSQWVSQRRYDAIFARDGFVLPEFRLLGPCLGAILMPISLIGFAWTSQAGVHWIAPTLFGVGFGTAMMWIFLGSLAYMLDAYDPSVASAALASNAIVRSFVAACFPEFCPTLFTNLSSQWAMTMVCGLSAICIPLPFLLKRYGAPLRARSPLTKQFPTIASSPAPGAQRSMSEKEMREKAFVIGLQC